LSADFLPLAQLDGIQVTGLQKASPARQLAALPDDVEILDVGPQLHTFADTAALLPSST
jgi:hypothetical protein